MSDSWWATCYERRGKKPLVPEVYLQKHAGDKTDAEIALLANLLTLTPGTLSLDVSTDRKVLYIHTLDVEDVDALRVEIKRSLERALLELMR